MEVDPRLAHDSAATVESALKIKERIGAPNLLVKIPATKEGVSAVKDVIAQGVSVNVTLIFSRVRYREVMEAYVAGLEEYLQNGNSDLRHLASVASFFISRTDVKVDSILSRKNYQGELAGKAAVATAKLAYQDFLEMFSSSRWNALAEKGAQVQRPLWASTSTKNPDYPDLLYVDNLIGPNTVNTMPEATLRAYQDHGRPSVSLLEDIDSANTYLKDLTNLGVDLDKVALELEDEGVEAFKGSHVEILKLLEKKLSEL